MMSFFLKRILLAAGLVLFFSGPGATHAPELHGFRMVVFQPPAAAPGFRLAGLRTAEIALENFRGRFVLLNFWATWCPPCIEELPSLQALAGELAGEGLSVVAISVDKPEDQAKVARFATDLGLTFAIPLDSENAIAKVHGVREFPSTFLIDPEGRIVAAAKGERDWASKDAVSYFREHLAEWKAGL